VSKVDTPGISIQRFAFGETSQVVHFLTEMRGRVVVLARGAYREKNSYEGPIDLLVRGRLQLLLSSDGKMGTLQRRKVETSYPLLRHGLVRLESALYFLGLILDTTPVGEGAGAVFHLFDRALHALETYSRDRLPVLQLSFELHLLLAHGLQPSLERCVRCGSERGRFRIVAAEGGVICGACPDSTQAGATVPEEVRLFLLALLKRRVADIPPPQAAVFRMARRIVDDHLRYHLERPAFEQAPRARPRRSQPRALK